MGLESTEWIVVARNARKHRAIAGTPGTKLVGQLVGQLVPGHTKRSTTRRASGTQLYSDVTSGALTNTRGGGHPGIVDDGHG